MEDLLKKLGYSRKWIDYGFLDHETLREQEAQLAFGEDRNTGHLRLGSFRALLKKRSHLSGVDVDRYVELALEDSDQSMAKAVLGELARWPNLGDPEYEKISSHEAFQSPVMRDELLWGKLIRALNSSSLTSENCDLYMKAGNSAAQRLLIDKVRLTREQLKYLAEAGKSRAIRNMAAEKLRSAKYREVEL